MYLPNFLDFGNGVLQLEEGDNSQTMSDTDAALLQISSIQTSTEPAGPAKEPSLPASLQQNLVDIWVTADGFYGPDSQQVLSRAVISAYRQMTVNQTVLIINEDTDDNGGSVIMSVWLRSSCSLAYL